jgi:hypothetical protein
MTTVDRKIEQAADKLQEFANRASAGGGLKAKLAEPLAEDADLIRRMKPSLIKARLKGEAPMNQKPGATVAAPSGPQLGSRTKPRRSGGPTPWLVVGVALAAGIFVAKWIDWRGHAHPRD